MKTNRLFSNRSVRTVVRAFRRSTFVLELVSLVLAGCADDTQAPSRGVTTMAVTPLQADLVIGDTLRITGLPKAADGRVVASAEVQWTIDDTSRATLTPLGQQARIAAKKTGTVRVTGATSAAGQIKTAEANVFVVNPAPALATLLPGSLPVATPGHEVTVTGTGFVPESKVLWNNEERATTYVSATSLRVQLTTSDLAHAAIAQVRVANPAPGGGGSLPLPFEIAVGAVDRIDLNPTALVLNAGQTIRITATPRDAFGNPLHDRVVTWSSGSPTIATVDATGLVTAIAPGTAVITAHSDGRQSSAVLEVRPAAAPSITSITPHEAYMPMDGQTLDIVVRGTGFSPNATVYVGSAGRYSQAVGTTELHATLTWDDLRQPTTHRIRVFDAITRVWSNDVDFVVHRDLEYLTIAPPEAWLFNGETVQLQAIGRDAAGNTYHHPVTWISETPTRASVDADGTVRALSLGQAIIRATMKGRTTTAAINSITPPQFDLLFDSDRSGTRELYLLTPGSSAAPRRLLPAGMYGVDPAVSPDGNRIAFVGTSGTNVDIFVVNRDGSGLRRLTDAAAEDDQPTWSHDGSRIAFRSARSGYRDIWVMDAADGGNLRNLTGGGLRVGVPAAARPTWSPDGSRIAFSLADLSVQPLRATIVSVDPNGQNARLLVGSGDTNAEPTYSPDGQDLAFRQSRPGSPNVLMISQADGTGPGWLFGAGHGVTPAWAPDSDWIAFASNNDPSEPVEIYVGRKGSPMRKAMTFGSGAFNANPTWIRR